MQHREMMLCEQAIILTFYRQMNAIIRDTEMKIKTKSYSIDEYWSALLIEMRTYSNLLKLRAQVKRERGELKKLDTRGLMDIGISHEDAIHEAARSYEDIPSSRGDMCKSKR